MIRKLIIIILMVVSTVPVFATDFWEKYGEYVVYNYTRKAGVIPDPGMSQRLSSDEVFSILTKSFSKSFGERFSEIARARSGLIFVCVFSKEGEKCLMDPIFKSTFDEIHFVNEPKFSQKFIKKTMGLYSGNFHTRDSINGRRNRANRVPPWKKFNPIFGFVMNDFELVVSSPFYTFAGIYVEPQYGLRKGASLGFMKDRWFLDIYPKRVSLKYRLKKSFNGKDTTSLTYTSGEGLLLENTIINW